MNHPQGFMGAPAYHPLHQPPPHPLQSIAASPIDDNGRNELRYSNYRLEVIQQPKCARVGVGKEKDRKPVDPPPIVRLHCDHNVDPRQDYLQSPYLMVTANLILDDEKDTKKLHQKDDSKQVIPMTGTTVSSLHRLKDPENNDGGFFVFGDLTVKKEGNFRLVFTLYNFEEKPGGTMTWVAVASIKSDSFTCHNPRTFPGMSESTFLTRSFSDQGVRLRLRKDSRQLTTKKRNSQTAELAGRARANGGNMREGRPLSAVDEHRSSVSSQVSYYDQGATGFGSGTHIPEDKIADTKRPRGSGGNAGRLFTSNFPGFESRINSTAPSELSLPAISPSSQALPNPYSMGPNFSQPYYGNLHQSLAPSPSPIYSTQQLPHRMPPPQPRQIDPQLGASSSSINPSSERASPVSGFGYSPLQSQSSPSSFGFGQHQQTSFNPQLSNSQALPGLTSLHAPQVAIGTPVAHHLGHVSPRSQTHTTSTPHSNDSPLEPPSAYTTAPLPGPQGDNLPPYSAASYNASGNIYDQSTLRENGLTTPLTGNPEASSQFPHDFQASPYDMFGTYGDDQHKQEA